MERESFQPHSRAKSILGVSCAVMTLIGVPVIAGYWVARGFPVRASVCAATFAGAMVAVHRLAYGLYRRQPVRWSMAYRKAAVDALALQLAVCLLASLVLDGGTLQLLTLVTAGAFWIIAAVVMCRRPELPTRGDLAFLRFGFLPLVVVAFFIAVRLWPAL